MGVSSTAADPRLDVRYLQMETGTACNYRCVYCPVAYHPRRGGFLPLPLVSKVVEQLPLFPNLRKVYLNGYDEPTLNPHLATIVQQLAHLPVQITLFTNGTNLTPDLANRLAHTGADLEIDIHLSAVERPDFVRIHGSRQFDRVMKNVRYLAEEFDQWRRINVCVSMQALDNPMDDALYETLQAYFADTRLVTFRWKPNDRAGILGDTPYGLHCHHAKLRGCSLNNRTREWIHINATGNVVLCCQDYFESHVLGNIADTTLDQIVESDIRRKYHLWTIGEVEAPDDYICRRCVFAVGPEPSA